MIPLSGLPLKYPAEEIGVAPVGDRWSEGDDLFGRQWNADGPQSERDTDRQGNDRDDYQATHDGTLGEPRRAASDLPSRRRLPLRLDRLRALKIPLRFRQFKMRVFDQADRIAKRIRHRGDLDIATHV